VRPHLSTPSLSCRGSQDRCPFRSNLSPCTSPAPAVLVADAIPKQRRDNCLRPIDIACQPPPTLLWAIFGATPSTLVPALPAATMSGRCRQCLAPLRHLWPVKTVRTRHRTVTQLMHASPVVSLLGCRFASSSATYATVDWRWTLLVRSQIA
jgi:hypothetical protein